MMAYEDLLAGLIELHVLYHAAKEEIFGLGMLADVSLGRTRRRLYRATPKTHRALAALHDLIWGKSVTTVGDFGLALARFTS